MMWWNIAGDMSVILLRTWCLLNLSHYPISAVTVLVLTWDYNIWKHPWTIKK